ncbi:hypothetical protein [Umezawaea sp.]|uniref:hypothetical protein n=1 Tax=Umezawaea sp. TaxID=1955258 RepID=UPI002ED1593F
MTNSTPPFTQRLALLLVAAVLCALVTGSVAFLAFGNPWVAVLAGLTALGGSFAFLHAHVR